MYITLGFKWFCQVSCPPSAFSTADSDEARNPQRFHICDRQNHYLYNIKYKQPIYEQVFCGFNTKLCLSFV